MASCRLPARPSPGEAMKWDQEIVRRLESRDREEFHRHKEMFDACKTALNACSNLMTVASERE